MVYFSCIIVDIFVLYGNYCFSCCSQGMDNIFSKTFTYDVDGNMVHMNTPVLLEQRQADDSRKLIQVLSKDFDHNEEYMNKDIYRPLDNNFEKAHMHARDSYMHADHRGMVGLHDDLWEGVLNQEYGPSFYRMLFSTFLQARPFSINTARGHTSENLRVALYKMLIQLLSPE